MGTPCTLEVPLKEVGYRLVLDTTRKQCEEDTPHWHLYYNETGIGQITWNVRWEKKPLVDDSIVKEAEQITIENSKQIREYYYRNRMYGYGA